MDEETEFNLMLLTGNKPQLMIITGSDERKGIQFNNRLKKLETCTRPNNIQAKDSNRY